MGQRATLIEAPDDLIHASRLTAMQCLILALCFVAYVLDGFDVAVISFVATAISQDLNVSPEQLGLIFSAGVLGMTLGAMFLASLADLYGRRTLAAAMLLMAGVSTVALAYAASVSQLIALRFVSGLGLGALMAALAPLVAEFSPRRHRTLILALVFSAGPLGPVIGGLIAAPMIAEQGWRSIFVYAGWLTVGTGALLFVLVPESMAFIIRRRPEGALARINRTLQYMGHATVERLPDLSLAGPRESASVLSLLIPVRRSTTLLLWFTFFLAFATVYFFTSWLPHMLVSAGFPQDQAIRGAVTVALGSVVGTTLFGALAKRWPLNRIVASAFIVGGVLALLLGGQLLYPGALPPVFVWLTLLLIGITIMGGFTNLYTIALLLYPTQVRSTGLGWAAGLGRGGAVLSPAIAGFLMGVGVSAPLLSACFAFPILLSAAGAMWLRIRELP